MRRRDRTPAPETFDRGAAMRELQLASIADLQGSIQAIDNKSSAALVVHGLLFAGVVSVMADLHGVYDTATDETRYVGGALLALAAIAFVLSVVSLIEAVRPIVAPKMGGTGAFFPPVEPGTVDDQLERLAALSGEGQLRREYACEQVKLAVVRAKQAGAAKRGFLLLLAELAFVGLFLLLVALVAVGVDELVRQP